MPTTTGKKIAIVTGSALGLGYELASQLIANGWLVAGVDFNAERQAELTAQWPMTPTAPTSATSPTKRS